MNKCQYQERFGRCPKVAVKRVRYHHDGYENDKYMWVCEDHLRVEC